MDAYERYVTKFPGLVYYWPGGDMDDVTGLQEMKSAVGYPMDTIVGSPSKQAKPIVPRGPGTTRNGKFSVSSPGEDGHSFNTTATVPAPGASNLLFVFTLILDSIRTVGPSGTKFVAGVNLDSNNFSYIGLDQFNVPRYVAKPTTGTTSSPFTGLNLKPNVPYHIMVHHRNFSGVRWYWTVTGADGTFARIDGSYSGDINESGVYGMLGWGAGNSIAGRVERLWIANPSGNRWTRATATPDEKSTLLHRIWLKSYSNARVM